MEELDSVLREINIIHPHSTHLWGECALHPSHAGGYFLGSNKLSRSSSPSAFSLILLVTFKLALTPLLTFSLRQGFLSMASVRPTLELQTCLRSSCCFQLFSFSNLSYNILRRHHFLRSFSFPWEPLLVLVLQATGLAQSCHGWMDGWMKASLIWKVYGGFPYIWIALFSSRSIFRVGRPNPCSGEEN